jgi:TRAP-type C4-dicarboxylate transport system permease small subunit
MLERLLRGTDSFNGLLVRISGFILGAMVLLVLTEIFVWNAFKVTTLIADEYSAYGLAIIIFLGTGATLRERAHIRITLIIDRLPERIANRVTFAAAALTTIFMGYLGFYLLRMMLSSYNYGSTSGTLTQTPLWIPQAFMVLGAFAFFLQLAVETVRAARNLCTGKSKPEEEMKPAE